MKTLGIVLILLGILLSLYVGGYLLFAGGISQIIDTVKDVDIPGYFIIMGIAKIMLAFPIGVIIAAFFIAWGRYVLDK